MESVELIQIQSQFKNLEKLIEKLAENKIVQPEANQSENINEIATALSLAQGEFEYCYANKVGCHSEYADLTELIRITKRPLKANGLSFTQLLIEDEMGMQLHTTLMHTSGQWIRSRVRVIPTKGDIRALGSQQTYLKRYALSGMLGILGASEDDDAELIKEQEDRDGELGTSLKKQADNKKEVDTNIRRLSTYQLDDLNEELKGWGTWQLRLEKHMV